MSNTLDDYCDCGAQHGIIDGLYKCTDSCMTTDIQALITEAEKKQLTWAKYYAKNWLHDCCEATHLTMIDEIDKRLTQLKENN